MEIPHLNKNSSTAVFIEEVLCKCTTLAWKLPVFLVLDCRNVVRTDSGGIIIVDSTLSLILYLLVNPTRRREPSPKLRIYVRNLAVVSCTASNNTKYVLRNLQHLAERGRRAGLTSRLASIINISLALNILNLPSQTTNVEIMSREAASRATACYPAQGSVLLPKSTIAHYPIINSKAGINGISSREGIIRTPTPFTK